MEKEIDREVKRIQDSLGAQYKVLVNECAMWSDTVSWTKSIASAVEWRHDGKQSRKYNTKDRVNSVKAHLMQAKSVLAHYVFEGETAHDREYRLRYPEKHANDRDIEQKRIKTQQFTQLQTLLIFDIDKCLSLVEKYEAYCVCTHNVYCCCNYKQTSVRELIIEITDVY